MIIFLNIYFYYCNIVFLYKKSEDTKTIKSIFYMLSNTTSYLVKRLHTVYLFLIWIFWHWNPIVIWFYLHQTLWLFILVFIVYLFFLKLHKYLVLYTKFSLIQPKLLLVFYYWNICSEVCLITSLIYLYV